MDGVLNFIASAAKLIIAVGLAYLAALWFALIVWTYRDIEQRSRSVITQIFATLLVVLFSVPGAILYLVLRPRETLDEAFQRSLEEEYLLQDLEDLPRCHGCHRAIESDWIVCPSCHTELRHECPNCGHLVRVTWDICPYCATELEPAATPETQESSIGRLMATIRERLGTQQPLEGGPGEPVYPNVTAQQQQQPYYTPQSPPYPSGQQPMRPPAPIVPMQRPNEQRPNEPPRTQAMPVRPSVQAQGDPYAVDLPVDFEDGNSARREPARTGAPPANPPNPNGRNGYAPSNNGNGYGPVPPRPQEPPRQQEAPTEPAAQRSGRPSGDD